MKGCCPRSDYWWSMAGLWGIILLTAFFPPVSTLVFVAAIPLTVQRLHDTGKNGSWLAGALAVIFTTRIAARLLGAYLPAAIAMTCISVMALCGLVYLLCQDKYSQYSKCLKQNENRIIKLKKTGKNNETGRNGHLVGCSFQPTFLCSRNHL